MTLREMRRLDASSMAKPKVVQAGRKSVKRGITPRYRVDVSARRIDDLPWLEFDGSCPSAVAEAARRAIAAELGVRADQVEVEPINGQVEASERRSRVASA